MALAEEKLGLQERAIRVSEKLKQELGPVLLAALSDKLVTDIWRNEDGSIWINRGGAAKKIDAKMSDYVALNLIGTVSGWLGMDVSADSPFLEGELPLDGSRFTASIPPVVRAPIIAIRKHSMLSRNLDDYKTAGILSPQHTAAIRKRIRMRDNILIAGGQGSGKSTLTNAILREMFETSDPSQERFAILEDTRELQVPDGYNYFSMRTNVVAGITMDDLLRRSLRLTGTRYVVGELRGKEAQACLEAWTSGHPGGAATIHAGSARGALHRFEQLIRKAGAPIDREEICQAVNLVIVITKTGVGRVVKEVVRVVEGTASGYRFEAL